MSARLSIDGEARIVWVGSELAIDGASYRVAAIDEPKGELGWIRLEPLE